MKKSEEPIRIFEDNYDLKVLPGIYIVSRLDGRGFNRLTKSMNCKKPFDDNFHAAMIEVVQHLMKDSGFNVIYGYTQSDEVSLLFSLDTDTFNRRVGKFTSVLSSMASSMFTLRTARLVSFDCRISHLPSVNHVIEYFKWRHDDAHRNALNSYCYWKLRETLTQSQAVKALNGKSASEMNEILFQNGINYNDVTLWHKRGTSFYWIKKEKVGVNPLTGESKNVMRNHLCVNDKLSSFEFTAAFLTDICNDSLLDCILE